MKSRSSVLTSVIVPARCLVGIVFLSVASLEVALCQNANPVGILLPEGQAVLSAGTTLEKRLYARPAPPDQAAVVIRGEGFNVDFRGAALQGADPAKVPASDFKGIGILLDGCRDVTLRNAVVNGSMEVVVFHGKSPFSATSYHETAVRKTHQGFF